MEKKLLTVRQLATACSTSRSTLLRMEEAGILEPVYINPDNGYRYYDATSVLRVNRNLSMQDMGITQRELADYYSNSQDYSNLLNKLQAKMAVMEYHIANLKLHLHQNENLSVSDYSLPEIHCVMKTLTNVRDLSTIQHMLWDFFYEIIHKGYTIDRQMYPFIRVSFEALKNNQYENIGYDYDICIPIIPNGSLPEIAHFHATDSISAVMYGGSKDIIMAFQKIDKEIERQHLSRKGLAIVLPIIRSLPGENIPMEYWVSRVCITVNRD